MIHSHRKPLGPFAFAFLLASVPLAAQPPAPPDPPSLQPPAPLQPSTPLTPPQAGKGNGGKGNGQGNGDKPQPKKAIAPEADGVLRRMSSYLAGLKSFAFTGTAAADVVTEAGQKITYVSTSRVRVRRPDGLRSDRKGAIADLSFFYDGESFSLIDNDTKLYAVTPAPRGLDAAIQHAREQLDLEAPAADLLGSDPYSALTETVQSGEVVGREVLNGTPVVHVAFRGEEVDYQLWIEEGPTPLPRRFMITTKGVGGAPDFDVEMDHWDVRAEVTAAMTKFTPPPGAQRIKFAREEFKKEKDKAMGK